MKKKSAHFIFIIGIAILLYSNFSYGNETPIAENDLKIEQENVLSLVALILPHHSLRNSETLHNWPFFGFIVPSWMSNIKTQKNFGKLLTLKNFAAGEFTFAGPAIKLDASLEFIHLLELGVQGNVGTAINYGKTATFMGVYHPEEKDYHQDFVFTEYGYGIKYRASLSIPLMVLLPKSNWTKIILKPSGELSYAGYTGAKDKQVWKAGAENMVNGFKYRYGGTIIYMLPFKRVPMAMVSGNVSAYKHEYDFDPVYKDYNPTFKTVNIMPMLSIKLSDKWNGMLMTSIARERKYENERYDTSEEMLQKQIGAEWSLKMIMFVMTRKF